MELPDIAHQLRRLLYGARNLRTNAGKCIAAFALIALSATSHATVVLEESEGYQRVRVTDAEFVDLLEDEFSSAEGVLLKAGKTRAARTPNQEMHVIKTLRAAYQANLPDWVQEDILEDYGFTSWGEVSDSQLDETIETLVISLDLVDYINDLDEDTNKNSAQKWFCSKKKSARTKNISKTINADKQNLFSYNNHGVSANLEADYIGSGSFKVDVHYYKHKRCGITYKLSFNYADIKVDADLGGEIGLTGEVAYSSSRKILQNRLTLWEHDTGFWAWIIYFDVDMEVGIDVGVQIDVEASATLNTRYDIDGEVGLTWKCTSSGCTKTRHDADIGYTGTLYDNYAFQAKLEVTPYADTNFSADVDIYGLIDMAEAKLGVVTAVPITYFGYYGNACSDANGDGTNELVTASLIDVRLEVSAYLSCEFFGANCTIPIDLNLGGFDVSTEIDIYTEEGENFSVYRKHLYFNDFINGSPSIFDPVVSIPPVVALDGGAQIGRRSCQPFTEDGSRVEIDWGDGSDNYLGSIGAVAHEWTGLGDTTVRVRTITDEFDRDVSSEWVTKRVNVSPDGQYPFRPWLVPVMSIVL
ncbi:MAG: hypothetical protein AB8G16_06805 [Gammaproteobacteria bacterium]